MEKERKTTVQITALALCLQVITSYIQRLEFYRKWVYFVSWFWNSEAKELFWAMIFLLEQPQGQCRASHGTGERGKGEGEGWGGAGTGEGEEQLLPVTPPGSVVLVAPFQCPKLILIISRKALPVNTTVKLNFLPLKTSQ